MKTQMWGPFPMWLQRLKEYDSRCPAGTVLGEAPDLLQSKNMAVCSQGTQSSPAPSVDIASLLGVNSTGRVIRQPDSWPAPIACPLWGLGQLLLPLGGSVTYL